MDKLPVEILDNIFTKHHFVNKLECMYVCKHWASVIREGSLLHTVVISKINSTDEEYFFCLPQEEPWRRSQVKKLLFGSSRWVNNRHCFRADLLVNLKFLYLSWENGVYDQYIKHLPREAEKPFMNNIEHVEDHAGSKFVYELLDSGICPRLTKLALELIDHDEEDDIYFNMDGDEENENNINENNQRFNKDILSLLLNAPTLRKLDFTSFDIQISDFELIHASLLQLESLTINEGVLLGDNLPDGVIPTGSLTKLSLASISINSLSLSNMIHYMIKKIYSFIRTHH
jgi:hypothetical protein